MRISEQQILMLFMIARDTCSIVAYLGGISAGDRLKLINDILKQQDSLLEDKGLDKDK